MDNFLIQLIFIAIQDGKTQMLLNELNVAHHLRGTPYRYHVKIALKQWPVVEMAGKMPTKVCVNAGVEGGILPTLPSHLRAVSLSEPLIHTDFADYTDF